MPRIGSADDARRRSLADLSILDAGDEGDPQSSPSGYLRIAALLPRNGGLFGSGWAKFMADRLGGGANASQGYPLGAPQSGTTWQYGSPRPANAQALTYRQGQTPSAPPRRPAAQPAAPTTAPAHFDIAGAFRDFQNGPKIPRPNLAESFIPVVGPAWEAVGDLQDQNYAGAAFNGAMAVADALPVVVAAKGVRMATKGVGILKEGSVSANAAAKQLRKRGVANKGEEIHHAIPLNGTSRTAQDWRNHYPFLKVLPKEVHRRLTGSWNGKPMYDPIRRIWYGTTDWMKAVPTGLAGYGADAVENLTHPFSDPAPPPPAKPRR